MRYFKILKDSFKSINYQFLDNKAHIKLNENFEILYESYNYKTNVIETVMTIKTNEDELNEAIVNEIIVEILENEYNIFIEYISTEAIKEIETAEQIATELENEMIESRNNEF
jgi:hypothetical protein